MTATKLDHPGDTGTRALRRTVASKPLLVQLPPFTEDTDKLAQKTRLQNLLAQLLPAELVLAHQFH